MISYAQKSNSNTKFIVKNQPMDSITNLTSTKLKIEVWSDIMCPFCYIGKRKFEAALEQFDHKNKVELIWKSYQLDPDIKESSQQKYYQYMAARKHIPESTAKQMIAQATEMAAQSGLQFKFDNAVPTNSFKGHVLSHLAAKYGVQNEAEELLFKAHFVEEKDIASEKVLLEIGKSIGLKEDEIKAALVSETFSKQVKEDIEEASKLGVQGVPFFVFNRKYAVSGAQASETFLDVIKKSYAEWEKTQQPTSLEIMEGKVCKPNGECK
jgi:predicted DsbA family dithiol-disulfide isomerase